MHSEYRSSIMRQLRDEAMRYGSRGEKVRQADVAEDLLQQIEPAAEYSYDFLVKQLAGQRGGESDRMTVTGEDLQHDLRLFIEDVSDAADLRVEEMAQPVYTVEDLSRMLNVSTKTISRWRQQGLVSRRFLVRGRKRVGFLQRSVDRFVAQNADRVKRGKQFSQLTDRERGEIIQQARQMARAGRLPSEVTRSLASRMNRSVETIRYTLKDFDRQHPELAIFPDRRQPLSPEAKETIYRQYRRGATIEELARRHGRSRSVIEQAIDQMRAEQIMELPLDYMPHESFEAADAEPVIMGPMPELEKKPRRSRPPAGLPPYLAALYDVPLLTREQEMHLFRKLNYVKFKASKLREGLNLAQPDRDQMDRIEQLYDQAVEVKNQIVQANLRLVVSIAKRHVTQTEEFFSLVSDGNMSLIRAVEKFDFSRGNKFSTYASWAIMKNFARTIPHEFKHRDRFRTSSDEMFQATEDFRSGQYEQESAQRSREGQIGMILEKLDHREQKIIIRRFGLDHTQEPRTLKEVGAEMGVTKERIRQIEARALNKLREAAREAKIELPDW